MKTSSVYREHSAANPSKMLVAVEASSFEEAETLVFNIIDEVGTAVFTMPKQTGPNQYFAFGHYTITGDANVQSVGLPNT